MIDQQHTAAAPQMPRITFHDTEDGWVVTRNDATVLEFEADEEEQAEQAAADLRAEAEQDFKAATTAHQRALKIAGIRALADFLDAHSDVPVGSVAAYGPYHYYGTNDRDEATAELAGRAAVVGDAGLLGTNYSGDPTLRVSFSEDVRWEETWPRDSVCIPRVEDGKVVWNLPEITPVAAEA